jgi:hypothetical protein
VSGNAAILAGSMVATNGLYQSTNGNFSINTAGDIFMVDTQVLAPQGTAKVHANGNMTWRASANKTPQVTQNSTSTGDDQLILTNHCEGEGDYWSCTLIPEHVGSIVESNTVTAQTTWNPSGVQAKHIDMWAGGDMKLGAIDIKGTNSVDMHANKDVIFEIETGTILSQTYNGQSGFVHQCRQQGDSTTSDCGWSYLSGGRRTQTQGTTSDGTTVLSDGRIRISAGGNIRGKDPEPLDPKDPNSKLYSPGTDIYIKGAQVSLLAGGSIDLRSPQNYTQTTSESTPFSRGPLAIQKLTTDRSTITTSTGEAVDMRALTGDINVTAFDLSSGVRAKADLGNMDFGQNVDVTQKTYVDKRSQCSGNVCLRETITISERVETETTGVANVFGGPSVLEAGANKTVTLVNPATDAQVTVILDKGQKLIDELPIYSYTSTSKELYSKKQISDFGVAVVTIGTFWFAGPSGYAAAAAGPLTTLGLSLGVAQAGVTVLFNQFLTGMVDTGGNVGETFKRITSKEGMTQTATAMLTAGALEYLNTLTFGQNGLPLGKISIANSPFVDVLGKNLIYGVTGAATLSALTGESFEDQLPAVFTLALLQSGAAKGAFEIGVSGLSDDMKLLMHTSLGCAIGAIKQDSSEGCAPGALGALAAELWAKENDAKIRAESATPEDAKKTILDQSTFAGTIAGCIVGGSEGCSTGGMTGSNAILNNHLTQHADVRDPKVRQKILDAGQKCAGPSSCESMVASMDAQIKLLSDDKIAAMCGTSAQCVTDRKDERGLYVQARNDAQYRLDNPDALALSYLRDQKNAPYDKDKLSASVTRVQNGTADPNDPVDQYVRDTLAANPAILGALLGATIVDTDGGKSGAKGSKPGVKNTGDTGASGGAGATVITPEMETKILFGERVTNASGAPTNRLIGAHAGEISNSNPNYAVEVLSVNADGTRNVKLVTQFNDGNLSKIKSSTLFPENWTSNQTMNAVKQVGDLPPVAMRADGAALYQSTVNGVQIEVIKVGNTVTAGYPVGSRGFQTITYFLTGKN